MTHEETAAKLARIEAMLSDLLAQRELDASPWIAGDEKAAAYVGLESPATFRKWAELKGIRPRIDRGMRKKTWSKHELHQARKEY